MKSSNAIVSLVAMVFPLSSLRAQGSNLLLNGSFELVDYGYVSEYFRGNIISAPEPRHVVAANANVHPFWPYLTDHTSGSGLMGLFNSGQTSLTAYLQRISLRSGITYHASGYVATLAGVAPNVLPLLTFRVGGNLELTLPGSSTMAHWDRFQFDFSVPSSGNYSFAINDIQTYWGGSDFALDDLRVNGAGTIRGTVSLGNWIPAPSTRTVTVCLRQGGVDVDTIAEVPLGPTGELGCGTTRRGLHTVVVKASHWLAQASDEVNLIDDGVTGLQFDLINGDCDGDNEIALSDYAQLAGAFGSVANDANWNPNADLDGDGEVTLSDYAILSNNFGKVGD